MAKLKNILFILFLSLVLASCSMNNNGPANVESPKGMVLFYGNTCPHCQDLEKLISQYGIDKKLTFEKKEVFTDQNNAAMMGEVARKCGISGSNLGVPFFWDGKKCYEGTDEIINILKNKAGIK